jgi:acyl-CoA reductase-like NAD-dependent aldehyde dehydrogenase
MVTVPHLPLLRFGEPYESVDVVRLAHVATGEPVAEVSHANPGLVARDLVGRAGAAQRALGRLPAAELAAICRRAADLFAGAELPAGDTALGPERFVRCQSATTGMPETLCRANMTKIETVLGGVEAIIAGLSRGLDLEAIDRGFTTGAGGRPLAYRRETDLLGAVLPSNSPGVHGLWIPALALKVALALKPGAREPWTPLRVAAALAAAGCPPEAMASTPVPTRWAPRSCSAPGGRCCSATATRWAAGPTTRGSSSTVRGGARWWWVPTGSTAGPSTWS